MKKTTLLLSLICMFSLHSTLVYANDTTHNPPQRPYPQQFPPEYYANEYDKYNDWRLTDEERIAKFKADLAEHKKLTNGQKNVEFYRNSILRLTPDEFKPELVQSIYERNGLFERSAESVLKKMEDELKYAGKDVKTIKVFGIDVKVVN